MNRTPTKTRRLHYGVCWTILMFISGCLLGAAFAGVLAKWTAGVTYENLTEACKSRGGEVAEIGNDKVCVRSARSRSPQ